jgi:hypothetical protein
VALRQATNDGRRPTIVVLAVLVVTVACSGDDPSGQPSLQPQRATAPAPPAVLTLLVASRGPSPSRVFQVPGQPGTRPGFLVRPGQPLRVRVDNRDGYVHRLTLPQVGMDLVAWPRRTATSGEVRAPTTPGIYPFFCPFAEATMNGQLVVSGRPSGSSKRQPPHDPAV